MLHIVQSDDKQETMSVGTAIVSVTYQDVNGENYIQTDEGRYGYRSAMHTKYGDLIHVRTSDNMTQGCSSFVNAPLSLDEPWIALIQRGLCSFDEKITNAVHEHHASAVVVYDHEPTEDILIMNHKGRNYPIHHKHTSCKINVLKPCPYLLFKLN